MSRNQIPTPAYDATFKSDPTRFLWLVGAGPYPGPLPRPQDTTEPPADEVQAGEPGTATADGTTPVGSGAEAGPGDAQDTPETSAPGAAQESTDPDVPPSGAAPDKAAAPGAEQQAHAAPDAEPQL